MKSLQRVKKGITAFFKRSGKKGHLSRSGTGVDPGRESFVRLKTSEGKEKRNLLRKLNNYRARKKIAGSQSFQPPSETGNWRRRLLLVLCLTLAGALFISSSGGHTVKAFLADLDYFSITSVEINGCRQTSAKQVRTDSGITINSSLLFLNSTRVVQSITSRISWIKNVEIVKKWPDKVVIRVQEYEPHALTVVSVDGTPQLHYMDLEGEPFIKAEAGMDFDFPVITGLDALDNENDRKTYLDDALHFLKLLRANNPNLPAQSVSEIHIDPLEGLIIHMVEYPFPVFFGNGDVRKKYIRLRKVLEVLYKPRKKGMEIAQVTYIRMDYLNDKVIVGYSESG